MSIINEALKKTQQLRKLDMDKRTQVREKPSEQPSPDTSRASFFETSMFRNMLSAIKNMDFLLISKRGGLLTITVFLMMVGYISYQHARNPALPIVQAAISTAKEKLAFTGIFVSDKSKIAVINKQSYHLGDMVNGMKIIAINQDSVDLKQPDDKVIQIRAGATYLL